MWPFNENLTYINPTLLTAGMGGFPLGDLYQWFPEKYAQWKAQEESENARISDWLHNGKDPGTVDTKEQPGSIFPSNFSLGQNYPNPFNLTTQIEYSVPQKGYISLKVYNLIGAEVATLFEGVRQAGNYIDIFDGAELASGVYLYQLRANNYMETKKFILLK